MRHVLSILVVGLILLTACGGREVRRAPPPVIAGTWTPPAMLGHVPADSPYVVGVVEPLPAAVRDLMFATADKKLAEAMKQIGQLPPDLDRSTLPAKTRAVLAVFDELRGKDLTHWGRELGFDPQGRFVLYGLSVWPVLRMSVADPAKVRRIAKRVIGESGMHVEEGTLGGHAYWRLEDSSVTVLAAVLDDEAVVSLFPTSIASAMLPLVLGTQSPPLSLRDAGTLTDITSRYQLIHGMLGYLDLRAAANVLTRRVPSDLAALDRPITDKMGPVSTGCAREVDRLVALVPRVIVGYRTIDATGMHARIVAEASGAVSRALARLRVAVPEVTQGLAPSRPIGALGVAVSLDELVPLLRAVARDIDQQPFACSWFSGLNTAAARVLPIVTSPLPPALQGLRGFSIVLEDLVRDPLEIRGHILLDGAHALEAFHLALTKLPGLGGLTVPPTRAPVALPLGLYGVPASIAVHAAALPERVGIAVGDGSPGRAAALLELGTPARSPLVSFAMDTVRAHEIGWLSDKDMTGSAELRDVAIQLDVIREGLVMDMYVTFPRPR